MYLHLDGELDAKQSLRVQEHLDVCPSCREIFVAERWIHTVSVPSAAKVEAPESLRRRIISALSDEPARLWRWPPSIQLAAVMGLFGVTAIACLFALQLPDQAPSLLRTAVSEHERYSESPGQLMIRNHDAASVSAHLEQRLPFQLGLSPGPVEGVTLAGGTVLSTGKSKAAFLLYRVRGVPVSLLLSMPQEVVVPNAEIVTFKNIIFHPGDVDGYHTLQWSDQRLTYVLVSEAREAVHEACVICHASPQGRETIAGFFRDI